MKIQILLELFQYRIELQLQLNSAATPPEVNPANERPEETTPVKAVEPAARIPAKVV